VKYDPFKTAEFPKASMQSPGLRAAVADIAEVVAALRTKADLENRMVYFKKVPADTSELPELPAPTHLNLPSTAYTSPDSKVRSTAFVMITTIKRIKCQ
jgi:hypothetical protein